MCAMNGYIFLIADIPGVNGIVHRYSLDGEREASFGYRYRTPDSSVQQSLSYRGRLACNEEHGMVAWIRDYTPILTGYSSDGDQMWQVRLADFRPRLVESGESSEGAPQMRYHQPQAGQSAYFDLFSDSGSHFYVLYGTFRADGNGRAHMLRIDALTGLGEEVANAGPPMPRLIDGEYFVTYMSSPNVKFTVYRPSGGSS